jgi:hypothetical protein
MFESGEEEGASTTRARVPIPLRYVDWAGVVYAAWQYIGSAFALVGLGFLYREHFGFRRKKLSLFRW